MDRNWGPECCVKGPAGVDRGWVAAGLLRLGLVLEGSGGAVVSLTTRCIVWFLSCRICELSVCVRHINVQITYSMFPKDVQQRIRISDQSSPTVDQPLMVVDGLRR